MPYWARIIQARRLPTQMRLYIYANPRPGNVEFTRHLEAMQIPTVRYAKKGDVVSHLPAQAAGYSQLGQEYYDATLPFMRLSLTKCAADVLEDATCSLHDSSFLAINLLTPFQSPLPSPLLT